MNRVDAADEASVLFREGRYAEALERLSLAMTLPLEDAESALSASALERRYAQTLARLGRRDDAVKHAANVTAPPESPEEWLAYGECELVAGRTLKGQDSILVAREQAKWAIAAVERGLAKTSDDGERERMERALESLRFVEREATRLFDESGPPVL